MSIKKLTDINPNVTALRSIFLLIIIYTFHKNQETLSATLSARSWSEVSLKQLFLLLIAASLHGDQHRKPLGGG
jgi:hypothetical protein